MLWSCKYCHTHFKNEYMFLGVDSPMYQLKCIHESRVLTLNMKFQPIIVSFVNIRVLLMCYWKSCMSWSKGHSGVAPSAACKLFQPKYCLHHSSITENYSFLLSKSIFLGSTIPKKKASLLSRADAWCICYVRGPIGVPNQCFCFQN